MRIVFLKQTRKGYTMLGRKFKGNPADLPSPQQRGTSLFLRSSCHRSPFWQVSDVSPVPGEFTHEVIHGLGTIQVKDHDPILVPMKKIYLACSVRADSSDDSVVRIGFPAEPSSHSFRCPTSSPSKEK
jgi:hypothetical protein